MSVLSLAITDAVSFVVVWIFGARNRRPASISQSARIVLLGLAFICLGADDLNAQTASPSASIEIPFLATVIVIAVVAGVIYLLVRKRFNRKPGNREARRPDPPSAQKPEERWPYPTSAKSPSPRQDKPIVFISYRRDDSSDVAGRIYDRLIQRFGNKGVFKDVDSIPLGVDFRKHLADSVGQCRILLAVIGKNWSADGRNSPHRALDDPRDFVRIELETAFERGIPVIPVLVQGATVPIADQLPSSIQSLAYHNGLAVRPDPDFHQDMARLIRGIEHHVGTDA